MLNTLRMVGVTSEFVFTGTDNIQHDLLQRFTATFGAHTGTLPCMTRWPRYELALSCANNGLISRFSV